LAWLNQDMRIRWVSVFVYKVSRNSSFWSRISCVSSRDLTTAYYDIRAIYVTHNATIVCVVKFHKVTWRDHMRAHAHVQILRVPSRCLFNLVAHWMWNKDNLIPESLFLKRNVYEKLGKYSIINVYYSISLIFCIFFQE